MRTASVLYSWSLLKHEPLAFVKRFLFLMVAVCAFVAFSMTHFLPVIDQLSFYSKGNYSSIVFIDDDQPISSESIPVSTVDAATVKIDHDLGVTQILTGQSDVVLFDVSSVKETDYDTTMFCSENIIDDVNPGDLQPGEAIVSYNFASALGIKVGDSFSLVDVMSSTSYRDVAACDLVVVGIMHTLYADNYSLGSTGSGAIVANLDRETLRDDVGQAIAYIEFQDESNNLETGVVKSKRDYRDEILTQFFVADYGISLMSIVSLIAILVVSFREIRRESDRRNRAIGIASCLGMQRRALDFGLFAEQIMLVVAVAIFGGLLLSFGYFGAYIGYEIGLRTILLIVSVMLLCGTFATLIACRFEWHQKGALGDV